MKTWIFTILVVVVVVAAVVALLYVIPGGGAVDSGGNSRYACLITFNGHTYVTWKFMNAGGLAHDPDCKCKETKP